MPPKLKTISDKTIIITCAACKHTVAHEVANLLLVVDGETTTHEIRTRATCPKCLCVGNNTYRLVPEAGPSGKPSNMYFKS